MFELALAIVFISVGRHGEVEFSRYEQMALTSNPNKATAPPYLLLLDSPLVFSQRNNYLLAIPVRSEAEKRITAINNEMSIYPRSLLAWTNLKLVLTCKTLYLGGLSHIEPYQAISVPTQESLLISISGPAEKVKASVHHELFHFIDYRFGLLIWDVEWNGLNDPGFSYGALAPDSLGSCPSGFVSHYATSEASEDKAETFVKMITEPEVIERMIRTDPVIYKKVKCLRTRLVTICPEINEEFWNRILTRSVEQVTTGHARHKKLLTQDLPNENVVPDRQAHGSPIESFTMPIKLLCVGFASGAILWVLIHLHRAKR